MDPTKLNDIVDKVFPEIETNFTHTEIVDYATDITSYKVDAMQGFPYNVSDKTASDMEDAVVASDFKADVEKLHKTFFPDLEYTMTENVEKTAEVIENIAE